MLNRVGVGEGIPEEVPAGVKLTLSVWGPSEFKGERVARDFNRQLSKKDRWEEGLPPKRAQEQGHFQWWVRNTGQIVLG